MKEEKSTKKNKNKGIETIKKMWKTPRGRSVFFFAFYLIFFLCVILMIRNNNTTIKNQSTSTTNNKTQITTNYKLDKIEQGNYHFIREENKDGIITTFVGDSASNRSQVMMSKDNAYKNYFLYSDIVLEQENGIYKIGINPYLYPNFTVYKYIKLILSQATLKSKTEYEGENTIYQYEISTTTLARIVDQIEIDLDDPINTIRLEVNNQKEVVKISYELNSYQKYKTGIEEATLTLTISYSDFGTVNELEIPE